MKSSISETIVMRVVGEEHSISRASWRYEAVDPLAVQVDFGVHPETKERIVWHFARELLHIAVVERKHAGIGDVQIFERDTVTLIVAISSPDGAQALSCSHVDLARFLRHSYAIVARGKESRHLGVDTTVAKLLGWEVR